MFRLSPELKAKGAKAEADFADWLDHSGVAYMYVEQSPLTVPATLRGRIKRPDYLVGIPHAGMLAFDVKAKTVKDGQLLFNLAEVVKQHRFARLFNLTTYLACLDLEREGYLWWVPVSSLLDAKPEWRGKSRVVSVDIAAAFTVNTHEKAFFDVLRDYIEYAMGHE